MRFDDMLATVIAGDPASPLLRRNRWRQIADIVAQKGRLIEPRIAARALAELARERDRIPLADRIATAHALASHARFAPIVALFAHDAPDVARAMLRSVSLPDVDWAILIPALGQAGRAILRARDDLSANARRALAAMGPSDMRLTDDSAVARVAVPDARVAPRQASVAEDEPPEGDQIRDLVRRIDAFRESRENAAARRVEEPLGIHAFQFTTGADGAINWVAGAPRGPLIGLSIATPASSGLSGPDAGAVGAFRHRGQIHDARIVLPPLPGFAGSWRFSAIPSFDPASGRFEGYRGTVRRAAPGEDARIAAVESAVDRGDAMRQLVHELRTPLNAISGFAQMIEAQMMGPASDHYRDIADRIAQDAGASLAMIDSLDLALAPRDEGDDEPPSCTIGEVASAAIGDLADVASERDVAIDLAGENLDAVLGMAADRAHLPLVRLVSVLIQAADPGSRIAMAIGAGQRGQGAVLVIALPMPLAGLSPDALRDPPHDDAAGAAPARLALAFVLRLVDRALEQVGGALMLYDDKLILRLPGDTAARRTDQTVG
jgi:signal transduction histidine kinase